MSSRLTRLNDGIEKFVLEIKALGLWDWTTVVQFSEFARTLDPNSSEGVDHAWGGQHFHFGGAVSGGKVRGLYPYDFKESADNPIALTRGRMIPTFPWDAMLLGTAEWFGINATNSEMEKVLPMHSNFPSDRLYREADLYKPAGWTDSPSAPVGFACCLKVVFHPTAILTVLFSHLAYTPAYQDTFVFSCD